jgi:sucrose-6F-phosphate phosphohydrolase
VRRFLLCTDLDRTVIPNGALPESPSAENAFKGLVCRPEVTLAYVSGRHCELIKQAILQYNLPRPDFAITDVGTTIYSVGSTQWQRWQDWDERLASDWHGRGGDEVLEILHDINALTAQENEKQSRFKVSFYVPLHAEMSVLQPLVLERLQRLELRANLIWSIDEQKQLRVLDILPVSANKLFAIKYLMQRESITLDTTLFAGDSGNDFDVLASEIPSVLVANADPEVKVAASRLVSKSLYLAKGGFLGMNGNYRAGILEGVKYHWPDAAGWFDEIVTS